MYIKIRAEGKRFTLPLPNFLFDLGAWGLGIALKNNADIPLTKEQLRQLVTALKEAKRTFGNLTLVDIQTAQGEIIKIVL
jgi:hypothetical protein